MELETLDVTVLDYINEIKRDYEHQIHKLKTDVIEYHNKYLYTKEQLDLLLYKRYMRSAESIPEDEKQRQLFTTEAEPAETPEGEERTGVKSYSRKKSGKETNCPRYPQGREDY